MALHITGDPAADNLLTESPFALLVGMLLDQQFPIEHAFRGPAKIVDRLGSIDPQVIASQDLDAFTDLCATPPAIHRYARSMAGRVHQLAHTIVNEYGGDAAQVWEGATSTQDLLKRLTALPGYGDQKARIFAALLGKQLNVTHDGWRETIGPYAEAGSFRSVADVISPETLQQVRAWKKEAKAAAKDPQPTDK